VNGDKILLIHLTDYFPRKLTIIIASKKKLKLNISRCIVSKTTKAKLFILNKYNNYL